MKIESIIKRTGGTVVDLDAPTRQYHFKPEDGQPHEAPHVAIVTEASHIAMLLRIREGFRAVEGEEAPESDQADGFLAPGQTLTGSSVHNATYPIAGDETITLGELVVMAFQDSGLSYEQWEDLADQERYEYIDSTLRELQAGEGELDEQPAAPVAPAAPVSQQQESTEPKDENNPPPAPPAQEVSEQQQENNPPAPAHQENSAPVKTEPAVEQVNEVKVEDLPVEQLRERFKAKFGRYPSTQMKPENIVAALSEDDD